MHPPFVFTDHKVGPDVYNPKPHMRRNLPTRLNLSPAVGWPPVPLVAPIDRPPLLGPQLRLVPPPRDTLRDIVGRWLIRTGQRMILRNRPG